MPRKEKSPATEPVSRDAFLRSINLVYDAGEPERIAHFRPTAKTVPLLKALFGEEDDRALFVVAPYGSGKSLTATYALQVIENRVDAAGSVMQIADRLDSVSPELASSVLGRSRSEKKRGIAIALHGYCPNVAEALRDAAVQSMKRLRLGREARPIESLPTDGPEALANVLAALHKKAADSGCDQVVLLWDEFGRHLESLLREGRASTLADIQVLAEFVSRTRKVPVTIGLFLHQSLLQYAGGMTQSVRSEWTKIEGRFKTLQYVDDSKEIYRLIAEVVASERGEVTLSAADARKAAAKCKEHGLFGEATRTEIKDLLRSAFPLEPATLYLLPRLAARVAQNERTLFSFLYSVDMAGPVRPADLYDYFSPVMRADTSVGGTYRQWLETESALTKVSSQAESEALKAACLLSLGTSGERSRAGHGLLRFALKGYGEEDEGAAVVRHLVDRKLLLHRRHSDQVAVWHGTDVDLRGRLEEEKRRQEDHFNELEFLSKEAAPPAWRPVEYNDRHCVRRFLAGRYEYVTTLPESLRQDQYLTRLDPGTDGEVLYVLAETHAEIAQAEQAVRTDLNADRIVVALPREPLPIREAALEVWCLLRMQTDSDLVGTDPLVAPELQQMTDDARGHLQQLLDRLVWPGAKGPRWFHKGEPLGADSPRGLRTSLSNIMARVFEHCPRINNEMIVRHRPSSIVVNARKKLVLGILERSGMEGLGIEGNFPDSSMFRCVLLHTGLYQSDNGRWRYAKPEELDDPGLKRVWREIRDFLTKPSTTPKHPRVLLHKLMEPPYGVRRGLLPILVAAGLKAFPSALSLTRDGAYVSDILPSVVESLCREPDRFHVSVLELDEEREEYLRKLHDIFTTGPQYEVPEADLVRLCHDALEAWKAQLPAAALTSRQLTPAGQKLQDLIRRNGDPVRLILQDLPRLAGEKSANSKGLGRIKSARKELMGVTRTYERQASAAVRRAIRLGDREGGKDLRRVAKEWAGCFSQSFVERMGVASASTSLLKIMQMGYKSQAKLVDSLATLLVGQPLARWDDSTIATFERELQTTVQQIEESALERSGLLEDSSAAQGLSNLVEGRIDELFGKLVDLVGEVEAERRLAIIQDLRTEEAPHG